MTVQYGSSERKPVKPRNQKARELKMDSFDEQNTEDAAGKGTNGVYKKKPVPGGGGPKGTYTPERD